MRSTESRPDVAHRRCNSVVSLVFPTYGETITSSIWRRIRAATAGSAAVESPLNLRSYRWGRRRSRNYTEGSVGKPHG